MASKNDLGKAETIGGEAASPPPPGGPPGLLASPSSRPPRLLASSASGPPDLPASPSSRPPGVNIGCSAVKADLIGRSASDLVRVGAADLVGAPHSKPDDKDFRKKGSHFIQDFYATLKDSAHDLHKLYNKRCMVSWTVLEESFEMKSAKEVEEKITVLAMQPVHFDLKHYEVHKLKKSLHISARGIFTLKKPYYFTQSLVVNQESLILSDILVINPEVSFRQKFRFRVKTASANSTQNRHDALIGKPEDAAEGQCRVLVVYNNQVLDHVPPLPSANDPPHKEDPNRIRKIIDKLTEGGIFERVLQQPSGPAKPHDVLRVHTQELVSVVDSLPMTAEDAANCPYVSTAGNDMYASVGSRSAIYYAAGAVLKACDSVMNHETKHAFALVRPPGHHASSAFAEGFCYFNNAAIAVNHLLAAHKVEKVALVDIDTHHGNGSQSIFFSSNRVLFFSMHCSELGFPDNSKLKHLSPDHTAIGEGAGRGFNVNIPMRSGYGDADILYGLDEVLMPLLKTFKPGAIVVSAGFDGAKGEMLGGEVSQKCYGTIAHKLAKAGNGQLILCLEGGYNTDILPDCVSHVIRSLIGEEDVCLNEVELRSLPPPLPDTPVTVRKLKKMLVKHWNVEEWSKTQCRSSRRC